MQIKNRIKELRLVKASELLPNPKNWRTHPKAQADAMRGALAEIGYADALIAYETDDGLMLIDGHLRAETTPDIEVPVLITDLNEEEAGMLLLTLDPLASMAEANEDMLRMLQESVEIENQALQDMIAGINSLDDITDLIDSINEGLTDPDDIPDEPEATWVQRGDLFQLGEHRLLCGDASDASSMAQLMGNVMINEVVTSPPYADARTYGIGDFDWDALMLGVFDVIFNHLADGANLIVNLGLVHRNRKVDQYWVNWIEWMESKEWALFGWYVWDKGNGLAGEWNGRLSPSHEFVFHFNQDGNFHARKWIKTTTKKKSTKHTFRQRDGTLRDASSPDKIGQEWKIPDSVIRIARHHGADTGHPAMFSVEFASFLCRTWTDVNDVIFDPMLGSGTTIIASERLKRICYGMEIEPKYVQIAIERWENYTGRKAEKLNK
jgi:DNA modification methylase